MSLVQKPAPDFLGKAVVGKEFKEIKLTDYKGKWLVLFFYPLDFTFVCPTEITAFSDQIEKFKAIGAEVVGCSVDSEFSHLAWINTPRNRGGLGDLNYPLLSDITKKISADYGVLVDGAVSLRGLYIIDPDGVVRSEIVTDLNVGRNVDEVVRLIKAFQYSAKTGEVCPAGWQDGADTINPTKSDEYFSKLA
jgi:peroxiredoxin 3